MSFERHDHLVDGRWCDLEVASQVGLGGRSLVDGGVGVNEGEVLALLFGEARPGPGVTGRLVSIHHGGFRGGHRDEHTLAR